MTDWNSIGWRYWAATVPLLALAPAGWRAGVYLAIALGVVQIAHFAWRTASPTSLPVQVRVAYLILLIAGLWEPLQAIHWVQLVGTSARVLVGYCLLARTLSLMPWNRLEPLSPDVLRRTLFSMSVAIRCGGGSVYGTGG